MVTPIDKDYQKSKFRLLDFLIQDFIYKGKENPFTETPYMNFREKNGSNRSKDIDPMMERNNYPLGSSYCLIGIQDMLRAIEARSEIIFDLPKTGGTQDFFNKTDSKYKLIMPQKYSIAIWNRIGTTSGHAGLVLSSADKGKFGTFEFNTSPNATDEIVSDGEGCYFKLRDINGFGNMRLRGFIDIIGAAKT